MDSHAAGRHGVADPPVAMDVQTGNDIIAALAQEVIPTHIFYGTGYVIHGLGFQLSNGTRKGLVLEDSKLPVDLHDSRRMPVRAGHFIQLQPGELPTSIQGRSSNMGFLAFQVIIGTRLVHGGGRTLPAITGTEAAQQGEFFRADAPRGHYFKDFWWQAGSLTSAYVAVIPDVIVPGLVGQSDPGWLPLTDLLPRQ